MSKSLVKPWPKNDDIVIYDRLAVRLGSSKRKGMGHAPNSDLALKLGLACWRRLAASFREGRFTGRYKPRGNLRYRFQT